MTYQAHKIVSWERFQEMTQEEQEELFRVEKKSKKGFVRTSDNEELELERIIRIENDRREERDFLVSQHE